jgi:hypothetical protein
LHRRLSAFIGIYCILAACLRRVGGLARHSSESCAGLFVWTLRRAKWRLRTHQFLTGGSRRNRHDQAVKFLNNSGRVKAVNRVILFD